MHQLARTADAGMGVVSLAAAGVEVLQEAVVLAYLIRRVIAGLGVVLLMEYLDGEIAPCRLSSGDDEEYRVADC